MPAVSGTPYYQVNAAASLGGPSPAPAPAPSSSSTTTAAATAASTTPSIAVFLFAKEKLLFRYPDVDPFVVDVATPGSTNSGGGGGGNADSAAKQKSSTAGGSANSNNTTTASGDAAGGGRGEAASPSSAHSSSSSSRDRHHRGGSDGSKGTAATASGGTLHPDNLAGIPRTPTTSASALPTNTTTVTASAAALSAAGMNSSNSGGGNGGGGGGGAGNRLKKKSPHVHVTMAADVKGTRGNSPHVSATAAGGGGGGPSSDAVVGVAPQRGMRRPMSAYTLVNDSLMSSASNASLSSNPLTHRTGSPGGSGNGGVGATLEGRRATHLKNVSSVTNMNASVSGASASVSGTTAAASGSGGGSGGTTTQVQNTSTGSTRRQLSSASGGGSSHNTGVSSVARGGAGSKSSQWANSRSTTVGSLQQQQQQQQQQSSHQNSSGAATCVGIATNVLMHLLRSALNGCTTINMVNCTFLVFPLTLSLQRGGSSSTVAEGFAASLERQRPASRAATALLVVAMKQPDTDSGAIANFAQCFVNILCREEQRCHYVSNELDKLEALTNHWEVGGAAALANAAAADVRHQQQHQQPSTSHLYDAALMPPPSSSSFSHGHSPARRQHSTATSPHPHAHAHRTHGDYDYLFAPSRSALRGSKVSNASGGGNRTSSHGTHNNNNNNSSSSIGGGAGGQHRDASPAATSWTDPDYDPDVDDGFSGTFHSSRRGGGAGNGVRAASPSSGRDSSGIRTALGRRAGGGVLPISPTTAANSGASASPSGTSLYQLLAGYVRLAAEVQQVAQCIDLWNRTSRDQLEYGVDGSGGGSRRLARSACRHFFGGEGLGGELQRAGGVSGLLLGNNGGGCGGGSRMRAGGNAATSAGPVIRDPFRRFSNVGTSPSQTQPQSWITAAPGEALDTLPDAILVNQMLLLPMSHLTGQERLEQAHTMRSAYSRIHPCSVVTGEESQFTEELQRRYTDTMGRRYAKLIPLSTVYALLLALPSPRRAGSLYRSIELTLLEAVQRRHARAAAATAAAAATSNTNTNNNTTGSTNNVSSMGGASSGTAAGTVSTSAPSATTNLATTGSYPAGFHGANRSATTLTTTRDSTASVAAAAAAAEDESNALAAAAATTAAGLDFLAMEIIDFLRVHGAISVASEMWVCFTHGEVTPVDFVAAAVERRRRHRLRRERRARRADAEAAAAAAPPSSSAGNRAEDGGKGRRGTHSDTAGTTASCSPTTGGGTNLNNSSWASSEATTVAMEAPPSKTGAATTMTLAAAAVEKEEPLDNVKDIDTLPAALVLHMLERVVDAQHSHQPSYMPTSASAGSLIGGTAATRFHGDAETLSNATTTAGVPKSPSTGNTTTVAAAAATMGAARTPRSTETDGSGGGRASFRTTRPLDMSVNGPGRPYASTAASVASSPSLTYAAAHTQGRVTSGPLDSTTTNPTSTGATAQTPAVPAPSAQLAVYCAWGSACPLCEQLASHPQCWTAASNRAYTVGYYVMNTTRRPRGTTALQLNFPSLDASVCTCARHARRIRDHADLASLMQSSYSFSGGSALVGQRGGGASSSLLHSLQPWFVRPHMFVTPITAAYGASPFEIYERMSYHSNRPGTASQRQGTPASATAAAAAGVPIVVPVNNTSSLVEPERRDMLMAARAQASVPELAPTAASSRRGAVVGAAEEQGHTLLQCADIPAAAVDYLRRSADGIRKRLAYSRTQQQLLARFEQARERGGSGPTAAPDRGGAVPRDADTKTVSPHELTPTVVAAAPGGAGTPCEHPSQTSTSPSADDAASDAANTAAAAAATQTTPMLAVNNSRSAPMAVSASSAASLAAAAVPASSSTSSQPVPVTTSKSSSAAVVVSHRRAEDELASSPLSSSVTGLARLGSSSSNIADARPRSIRYGRRQLPLHTATSPLTNVNLLFDSTTPSASFNDPAEEGEKRPLPENHAAAGLHRGGGGATAPTGTSELPAENKAGGSSGGAAVTAAGTTTSTTATATAAGVVGFPYTGVKDLLDGERTLPVEVLLQYVLHHLVALSWGRRGVEVDTLVRLLERNLRRLPPLLANLQYVRQLRSAGFTSESAAAAVAAQRAPATTTTAGSASGGSGNAAADGAAAGAPTSAVFTAVHTRLAASPFSVLSSSAGGPGTRPSPTNLADSPDEDSETSPFSGGSRAATALPVTESEVQLLQAYEVLERLSLMDLLGAYATWPVRTVPTRLLLHTVVNEFCDVLYVDSSERDEEADHWDLPVAAQ